MAVAKAHFPGPFNLDMSLVHFDSWRSDAFEPTLRWRRNHRPASEGSIY